MKHVHIIGVNEEVQPYNSPHTHAEIMRTRLCAFHCVCVRIMREIRSHFHQLKADLEQRKLQAAEKDDFTLAAKLKKEVMRD